MPRGDWAEMTVHRATATMPAPDGSRELSVGDGSPSPSAASALPCAGGHAVNGASAEPSPAAAPAGSASTEAAPGEVAERYLSPALKAAAAARARTARIRATAWATVAGPVPAYPRPSVVEPVAASPAAPALALALPPARAHELQIARMAAALTMAAGSDVRSAMPPAAGVPVSRGLSVAEAARASWIRFHPLRQLPVRPAATPAAPGKELRGADERPAAALAPGPDKPAALVRAPIAAAHPTVAPAGLPVATARTLSAPAPPPVAPARPPVAPARTLVAPARTPGAPARTPVAPARTRRPVSAPVVASAKVVTRPGGARLLPAAATRPAVPERGPREQRFTKTIAELQRHQAATRPNEPWGNVVPRPAVPQAAPGGELDTVWARLWSRR